MDKKEALNKAATKVITYGQVISRLNSIAKQSGNAEAYFSSDLISPIHGKTVGFKFASAQQGAELGTLLESLGMRFVRHHATLNEQVGELHIAPEHAANAKKLFDNWCSWVTIEPRITGNKELDSKRSEIVGHTR